MVKKSGLEKCKKNERSRGFHTRRFVLSPNTIPPEQVLPPHCYKRRGCGGTGAVPSVIIPVLCMSKYCNRNSTGPKNQVFDPVFVIFFDGLIGPGGFV